MVTELFLRKQLTLQMETSQICWVTLGKAPSTHTHKGHTAVPTACGSQGCFPTSAMDSWELGSEKSACPAFGGVEEFPALKLWTYVCGISGT